MLQAAYLTIGKLAPDYENVELSVGGSTVAAAVVEATGVPYMPEAITVLSQLLSAVWCSTTQPETLFASHFCLAAGWHSTSCA